MISVEIVIGVLAGYGTYFIGNRFQKFNRAHRPIRFKRLEFLPHFSIRNTKTKIHIHHWTYLVLFFGVMIFQTGDVWQSYPFIKAVLAGGAIQGLIYPDRFSFVEKI